MVPSRLGRVIIAATAAILLDAAALLGGPRQKPSEDMVRLEYRHASHCEVSRSVGKDLGIRIERDQRVTSDVTYRSPHEVPISELFEEYERLLHANGVDLIQVDASRYVIVPAGVRTPGELFPCTMAEADEEPARR